MLEFPTEGRLSTESPRLPSTSTVSEIGGSDAPAGIAAVVVHVTSYPAAEQVQPLPVPESKVRPVASRSSTVVVVPAGIAPPSFCTVRIQSLAMPATKSPECDFTTDRAFGTTEKAALRLWVIAPSRPSAAVTVAVQVPKLALEGIV